MPHCIDTTEKWMEPSVLDAPTDRTRADPKINQLLVLDHAELNLSEVCDQRIDRPWGEFRSLSVLKSPHAPGVWVFSTHDALKAHGV